MNSIIRPMTPKDKNSVLEMMRVFYTSPAVFTNGSDDIFRNDIENCINDCPYLEGYIFEVSTTSVCMFSSRQSMLFAFPLIVLISPL